MNVGIATAILCMWITNQNIINIEYWIHSSGSRFHFHNYDYASNKCSDSTTTISVTENKNNNDNNTE